MLKKENPQVFTLIPNGKVAKLLKVNKQQMPQVFLLRAFCSFWGSWRTTCIADNQTIVFFIGRN